MIHKLVIIGILLIATAYAYSEKNNVLILSDADLEGITDQFPHILIGYFEP